ncbi:MAG: phosphoglycerate dehydrogenase [Deltaproteobacteria bacterium]|nr:MAG: phosphoglycerate dehydrogenase [Deltaproteobacteria bacterium]
MRILVCDGLHRKGVKIFEKAKGIEVEVHERLGAKDLLEAIQPCEGVVVRSRTNIDRTVLENSPRLRVIGRAGIGVDNIDLEAATQRGILVMNTPGANAVAAAEHAMALMLALSRHIPRADQSVRDGRWEKKKFVGTELYNQTLGIIGVGRIGSIMANRAQGMKMRVLAYDPYVSAEVAAKLGVELVPPQKLFRQSDFISIHTPFTKETRGLLDETAFKTMKRGVRIINCARGGIIDENALYQAIKKRKVAGAALDVFEEEPPVNNPLLSLPQVIATPHLGASSEQAQVNVATAIAEQMVDYLQNGLIRNAVNMPSMSPKMVEQIQPYMLLAERLGRFLSRYFRGNVRRLKVGYGGDLRDLELAPVTNAAQKGFLERALAEEVNLVNAPVIMKNRGIQVDVATSSDARGYAGLITLAVVTDKRESRVAGTVFPAPECRIVEIDDYRMEAPLEGRMLLISNYDRPGVIGFIGTTLGDHQVNIADMHLSRIRSKGTAICLVTVDNPVSSEVLQALRDQENIIEAMIIEV